MTSTPLPDIYQHNFSIEGAKEIISTCLDNFDNRNPDSLLLLKTISKLTLMLNTAKYDYTVLENLILENEALTVQCRELELNHISKNIEHMSFRVNSLQKKCENLKEILNQTEYMHPISHLPVSSQSPMLENDLPMAKLGSHNINVNLRLNNSQSGHV